MKISALNNNNNYSSPNFGGINAQKILTKASSINSWQQRLALGASAVILQPAIDMANKDVDKETGRISAIRSLSKALVGATTGIAVRGGSMKIVECALKNENLSDKLARITAEDASSLAIDKAKDFIKNQGGAKQYASVIGTIAALGIMIFTNFLIDAPLTNILTNKLNKKQEEKTKMPAPNIQKGGLK